MKTPLRRLCKMLPASIELQQAVALDELGETGIPQGLSSLAGELDDSDQQAASNGHSAEETQKMDEIRDKLKSGEGTQPTTESKGESLTDLKEQSEPPPAPLGVDDVQWKEFITYIDDNLERAKLKKRVKERMGISDLKTLRATERRAFILTCQDEAKRQALPLETFCNG